ncbi:MAG: S8 family serine peptidase [Pseudomonadota bacterium]|nr:S8 family serine peptidase [Pseudomonadota bacterium]
MTARKQPRQDKPTQPTFLNDAAKIVVRFRDLDQFRDDASAKRWIDYSMQDELGMMEKEFGPFSLAPLLTPEQTRLSEKLVARANERDKRGYINHFRNFYTVDFKESRDMVALVKSLCTLECVQTAYIDKAAPDPLVDPTDDPRSPNQGYLDAAPDGIDAEYAWSFTGGDGAGQRFIDLERGWTLDHEDLNAHGGTLLHGTLRDDSRAHGTSVLGEICAVDNTLGCVGIVPHVDSYDVVSFHGSTRVAAILAAIDNLNFGEVLLLEAQVWLNGTTLLGPIEAYDAEFEAIRLATALGVIVVEAGGNGTNNGQAPALDMDTYTTLGGEQIFNPASTDFRDSGAIIVTAATSAAPHIRRNYGPYGERIDCYAWSQNIDTCSSNSLGSTTAYTTTFGGTSGASPIITGAALAIQGVAESQLGFRFGPYQMRSILRNPANGTPPDVAEVTAIGVMPDLRQIIDNVLNVAPDVYLRDFVGDVGEPHNSAISASPDIILQPNPVPNPQLAYGAGSGTENSNSLGFEVEAGQDNYIYTRVLNQGGSNATDVEVTLYWSEVSTLVTPDMWNEIGSTIIPNVPAGEVLTVSDAIVWQAADIPATGHYCIVGIIGTANDPAPNPAEFLDWANFQRFIRDNNNVTWRNFNVVDYEPDTEVEPAPGLKFKALEFVSPGIPRQAVPMQLEFIGKLPEGARVYLEVPGYYGEMLLQHGLNMHVFKEGNRQLLPVKQNGRLRLPEIAYPAKIRNRMRLLVHLPEQEHDAHYDVAVRQLSEGEEVGRVTWRLQAKVDRNTQHWGFQIYKDKAGEYRWRLLAGAKNIIADSGEGFKTRQECEQEIALVKRVCRS